MTRTTIPTAVLAVGAALLAGCTAQSGPASPSSVSPRTAGTPLRAPATGIAPQQTPRADARPRPAAAVIPSGVTRIVVLAAKGFYSGGGPVTTRTLATVTDPTLVAETVALVNALPGPSTEVAYCMAAPGIELVVDFYQGSGGANATSPAAEVVDRLGGDICGGTLLSVRGGPQQVPLADSLGRTLALLKLTFPGRAG